MAFAGRIAELKEFMKTDADYAAFIETQRALLCGELQQPGVTQPGDEKDWWYTAEPRLGRTAALWAITGDGDIGAWLHGTALGIVRESADAWIGPFFRARRNPLCGMLETGHLSAAVGLTLLYAPGLFTSEELSELRVNLREKGVAPIERFLRRFYEDYSLPRNNWVISELSGLLIAACALGDAGLVRKYLPLFNEMHSDYNSDFYGEPSGYWTYSSYCFLKPHLIIEWTFPELKSEMISSAVVLNPFMWKYYRRQGTFLLQGYDEYRSRQFAFGDDGAIGGELSDNTLLYASVYHEDPMVRGLASACLEKKFFGGEACGKHTSRDVICLLPYRGREKVEESAFPPSAIFADGFMLYKDRWENPSIQIALKCGQTEAPRVVEHRHADHLSFQLAKDGVVILDDPSICCYRLTTYQLTKTPGWHSVPSFTTVGEKPRLLEQDIMKASHIAEDRHCRRVFASLEEHAFAVTGEAGELYPAEMLSVRRTFAAAGENVLVIADTYEASEPVAAIASFVGNNRRRGMKWTFGDNWARLSREGVGVHIAAMQNVSLTMDYAAINDGGSTYPDSPYQGREGSGYIVRMQTKAAAEEGRSVYVVFADREENLDKWSASMQGDVITVCESGTPRYTFRLGEEITVEENGVNLLK